MNPNEAAPEAPVVPIDPAAEQAAANAKMLETLTAIGAQVQDVSARVQGFEQRLEETNQPLAVDPMDGWKPQTWDDIPKLIDEKGEEAARRIIAQRDAEAENVRQTQLANQQAIDQNFEKQLSNMEREGKLPPIGNPNDENDPGRQARRELFGIALDQETLNLEKANKYRLTLESKGLRFDPKLNDFLDVNPVPAGLHSPVGSSSARSTGNGKSMPDYKTIHGRSMDDLVRMGSQY